MSLKTDIRLVHSAKSADPYSLVVIDETLLIAPYIAASWVFQDTDGYTETFFLFSSKKLYPQSPYSRAVFPLLNQRLKASKF